VSSYAYAPPQRPHIFDKSRTFHLRPFIYGVKYERSGLELDFEAKHPIYFFVKGSPYERGGSLNLKHDSA
jgi:peptide/nickel transport system permease protein